jgi:hypothetical protein
LVHFVEALIYKPASHGFDSCLNPSGCSMALGLTQPLAEISTRNISLVGGEGCDCGWCIGLKTLRSCAYCLETWEPQLLGKLRAYPEIALLLFCLSVMCPIGYTAVVPTSLFFSYSLCLFCHLQDGVKYFQFHSIGTMTSQQYDAQLCFSTIPVSILTSTRLLICMHEKIPKNCMYKSSWG